MVGYLAGKAAAFMVSAILVSCSNPAVRAPSSGDADLRAFGSHIPAICDQWYPQTAGYHGFEFKRPSSEAVALRKEVLRLKLRAFFYACMPHDPSPADFAWARSKAAQKRCYGPTFELESSGKAWKHSPAYARSKGLPPYPGDQAALIVKLEGGEISTFRLDFDPQADHGISDFHLPLSEILTAAELQRYRSHAPVFKEFLVFLSQGVKFMNTCRRARSYHPRLSVGYFRLLVRMERKPDASESVSLIRFSSQ
jgi:hypothetical protein